MQIDDEKESSKSDCSDTSYNSSTASECHTEDEFVQKSRSFTCSDVDSKHVKPKRKPRRLTRRICNQKRCKNKLMNIQDVSSDQSNGKANRDHVSNENVTAKEKPITDTYSGNTDEKSAEGNAETVTHDNNTGNTDQQTSEGNAETVTPDNNTGHNDQHSAEGNAETVTPDKDNVHGYVDNVNTDEVCVIVPVKTKEEEVKPNVQECVVHGNSAVSNQSGELFSDVSIKKEESENDGELNDSSISVKGKLSDEVSGRSFDELVTATNNGKQEDVDVDVSVYTDSAQTLQVDDKNTQYSGNTFLNPVNTPFVFRNCMGYM